MYTKFNITLAGKKNSDNADSCRQLVIKCEKKAELNELNISFYINIFIYFMNESINVVAPMMKCNEINF